MNNTKEFGLIGLGVMGKSLSRNLASKGFRLSLFNRHVDGKEVKVAARFLEEFPAELQEVAGFDDLPAFVQSLETPRKIFLMVNAGAPTDAIIGDLLPLLSKGDILIDGGNAFYKDTQRRMDDLSAQGIHFIGSGVSGGEEGALKGPSIMPGGNHAAYQLIAPYLERIAAKDKNGQSCCAYNGNGGAGHFVKMVHNGIEYAEMQLLAEAYFIMRRCMDKNPEEIAGIFEQWHGTEATSYLLEITIDILRKRDGTGWLFDHILDAASNKGTGGWATAAAAELGVPATMISEALFARYLSAFVEERQSASALFNNSPATDPSITGDMLRDAYQTARIVNHHQGIHLISAASVAYGWDLQLPEIARIWTNGCIIRSALMEHLTTLLPQTDRILLHPEVATKVNAAKPGLSRITQFALGAGLAIPCFSAAINFLNGYGETDSPMNLVQAQRDYFGAHTYQRKDDPAGPAHHTNWS
jgi:6-phosphogluconate dehydrogenase